MCVCGLDLCGAMDGKELCVCVYKCVCVCVYETPQNASNPILTTTIAAEQKENIQVVRSQQFVWYLKRVT